MDRRGEHPSDMTGWWERASAFARIDCRRSGTGGVARVCGDGCSRRRRSNLGLHQRPWGMNELATLFHSSALPPVPSRSLARRLLPAGTASAPPATRSPPFPRLGVELPFQCSVLFLANVVRCWRSWPPQPGLSTCRSPTKVPAWSTCKSSGHKPGPRPPHTT